MNSQKKVTLKIEGEQNGDSMKVSAGTGLSRGRYSGDGAGAWAIGDWPRERPEVTSKNVHC